MKIYLDTSVISALFDDKNPERKVLTEEFFSIKKDFQIYISEISLAEIKKTPDIKIREKMNNFICKFSTLKLTNTVESLAKKYISYGAIPSTYTEDAYHIGIAVINEVDYLLSWNFRHIVRKKTRDIVRMVNTLNNLKNIEIITPAELL